MSRSGESNDGHVSLTMEGGDHASFLTHSTPENAGKKAAMSLPSSTSLFPFPNGTHPPICPTQPIFPNPASVSVNGQEKPPSQFEQIMSALGNVTRCQSEMQKGIASLESKIDCTNAAMVQMKERVSTLENALQLQGQELRKEGFEREKKIMNVIDTFKDEVTENFRKMASTASNIMGASVNTAANEEDYSRCRRSLLLQPCYLDKNLHDSKDDLVKAVREYFITACGMNHLESECIGVEGVKRRGKKNVVPFTLEVLFTNRSDRDEIIKKSPELAAINKNLAKDDPKYRILPIYPSFLSAIKDDLMYEARKIREGGKLRAQIRYTDGEDMLAIFVRSDSDTTAARFWREKKKFIKEFGTEGFPDISTGSVQKNTVQ